MKKIKRPKKRACFFVWIWLKCEECEKGLEKEFNERFMLDHDIFSDTVLYLSEYSTTIIAALTDKQLEDILKDRRFEGVSEYKRRCPKKMSEEILSQMNFATPIQHTTNVSGVIGMISAEREIFYSPSPQLATAVREGRISVLDYPVPPIPALHPSVVLSQIIGEEVYAEGGVYRGVCPNASVVFSTSETETDVLLAAERMIGMGIKIINFSAGVFSDGYTDFDRQIDRLAERNSILFVTAAGNRRDVTSPGRAYNVLCVGNLQTKGSPSSFLSPPWSTRCPNEVNCSAYVSSPTLAHKPDVCAPGTYIPYVLPNYEVYALNTGTSFACPWVSGLALLISQERRDIPSLALKAIIALSCNTSVLSYADNPIIEGEPFMRERTGFGAIDFSFSLEMARFALIETFSGATLTRTVFLSEGDTLFAAVCHNANISRPDENIILELSARDSRISCYAQGQNLHIVKYFSPSPQRAMISVSGNILSEYAFVLYIKKREM